MSFLPPNQQRQNTKGTSTESTLNIYSTAALAWHRAVKTSIKWVHLFILLCHYVLWHRPHWELCLHSPVCVPHIVMFLPNCWRLAKTLQLQMEFEHHLWEINKPLGSSGGKKKTWNKTYNIYRLFHSHLLIYCLFNNSATPGLANGHTHCICFVAWTCGLRRLWQTVTGCVKHQSNPRPSILV